MVVDAYTGQHGNFRPKPYIVAYVHRFGNELPSGQRIAPLPGVVVVSNPYVVGELAAIADPHVLSRGQD
jgi:hypothetical protein